MLVYSTYPYSRSTCACTVYVVQRVQRIAFRAIRAERRIFALALPNVRCKQVLSPPWKKGIFCVLSWFCV